MKKITTALWRRFEEVVFGAIKSIMENAKIEEMKEKLTEATHDGGYDGIFLFPYIKDSCYSQTQGYYKILFEAKLRTDLEKDLPLQDFSKSLIIAINMDSDALIVATNLHLSEGTKEHLREFSSKTGLKTYYLSPLYIDTWLKEHSSTKNTLDNTLRNLLRNASAYSSLNTPLELLEKVCTNRVERLPELYGRKKKELLKHSIDLIKNFNGIAIIKGNAGAGKSFFCEHVKLELEKRNCTVYSIDLNNYQTPRVLFLRFLEILWHIPFESLLSLDKSGLEYVVNEVDSQIIDRDIKEAVLSAFSKDFESYSQNADIFNYYMTKYLLDIYAIRARHAKIILFISNLNSVSLHMIDFVYQFLNSYTLMGTAILELRTSTYIDMLMEPENWKKCVNRFCSMEKILLKETIEEFSLLDAEQYIQTMLEGMSIDMELIDSIIQITGRNPLYLSSLVEYLKITGYIKKLPRIALIQQLRHFIIDDKRQIISALINAFSQKATFFAEFFEMIRIFQFPILESLIENISCDYKVDYIDQLVEANLVYRKEGKLSIVHPLQFECILNTCSLMDSLKRDLAQKILDNLDDIKLSPEYYAMTQIRCYQILYKHQEVIDIEYPLAIELLKSGQYTLCYKYAKDALEKIQQFDTGHQSLILLKILLLMVEICIYLEGDSILEIDDYMNRLNYLVSNYLSEKELDKEYIIFIAQYYMTKNRYEHFRGSFHAAYETLKTALVYTEKNKEILGDQIVGNIELEYSIALKEMEDLYQSLSYLEVCLKSQPDNPELLFTYNTQMYELHLLDNPELSIAYVERNRLLYSVLNKATVFHNETHWLNAQYYLKNYDICFKMAISSFKKTGQMGLKNEEGRLANLIGNIYFQNKDFHNAEVYYQYGIDLFQEKAYVSNVWPLLVNMSSLMSEMRNIKAVDTINLAVEILFHSYRQRIQRPYPLSGYYDRIQVAVEILYYNIKKLENILPAEDIKALLTNLSDKLLTKERNSILFKMSCQEILARWKDTRHYHVSYLLIGN